MTLPTFGWLCSTLQASPAAALNATDEIKTISIDSRTLQLGDLFWALKAQRNGHDFTTDAFKRGARAAVVSSEWKNAAAMVLRDRLIGVADTALDLQHAARVWREALACPVVGITGTNGKTSTKDLIRRLLSLKGLTAGTEGNFNNEIGVPLTLLGIPRDADYAVVEMGASHRGDVHFLCEIAKPTHGLITSIGKAHLEGFGSLNAIASAKGELFDFVAEHGVAFVPTDDRLCREKSAVCRRQIGYGFQIPDRNWNADFHHGADLVFDDLGCGQFVFDHVKIRLSIPGKPAAQAALAAMTVAHHFGLLPAACQETISLWKGVHGRAYIEKVGSILLMDDSYNANPDSMLAALETLSMLRGERKTAVLGDMNELGDAAADEHRALARQLPHFGVTCAIFVGKFAEVAFNEAKTRGVKGYTYSDSDELIGELSSIIKPGDIVLVKGSRSVRLERIVDQLKKVFG